MLPSLVFFRRNFRRRFEHMAIAIPTRMVLANDFVAGDITGAFVSVLLRNITQGSKLE